MKKKLLLLSIVAAYSLAGLAQDNVGINTPTPDPSAALHVESTDKGVLIPRLTTAQRQTISNAATGLLVFDTDTGGFWFYNGTSWVELSDPNGDDVWQKNGNNIYYSQGKVGIGTVVPTDALTIYGTFATHTFDVNNQLIKSFSVPGWLGDRGTIINGLFDGRGFGSQIRFQGLPGLGFVDIGNNAEGNFTVEGINDVPLLTVEQGGDVKAEGRIKNVTDPVEAQDAATKAYVDAGNGSEWTETQYGISYPVGENAESNSFENPFASGIHLLSEAGGIQLRSRGGSIAIDRGLNNVGGATLYLRTFEPTATSWSPENVISAWRLSSNLSTGNFLIEHESDNVLGGFGGVATLSIDNETYNVGIGTLNPKAKLNVTDGDIYIENINKGVIMKSPNGQCWRMTVSNAGQPEFNLITCPN